MRSPQTALEQGALCISCLLIFSFGFRESGSRLYLWLREAQRNSRLFRGVGNLLGNGGAYTGRGRANDGNDSPNGLPG